MYKIDGVEWFKNREQRESFIKEKAKIDFSFLVKEQMKKESVSVEKLSEISSIKLNLLYRILSGDVNVTIESMTQIAKALGCTVKISLEPIKDV